MYPELRMDDETRIAKFLRSKPYSDDTKRAYGWHLKRLLRWLTHRRVTPSSSRNGASPTLPTEDLFKTMAVEEYEAFLDDQEWGASMRAQAQGAARAYARHYFSAEHPVFELPVRRPKPKHGLRSLSAEEVLKLLRSLDIETGKGLRNYAMVCVMADTGFRATEICNLELELIDLEKRNVYSQVKGGGWGVGRISGETVNAILDWLDVRDTYAAPFVKNLFVGVNGSTPGRKMTRSGLRSNCRRMAIKAGVKHFSPHSFRRAYATLTTHNHAPSKLAAQGGRWKDIRQFQHYADSVELEHLDEFLPVANILGTKKKPLQENNSGLDGLMSLLKLAQENPELIEKLVSSVGSNGTDGIDAA